MKARLRKPISNGKRMRWMYNVLVGGIEQEDESNDSVSSILASVDVIASRADRLEGECQKHTNARRHEEEATANTLNEE